MDAASWLGLDAFFDDIENRSKSTSATSSQTSCSSESSDGFVIDDNYLIIAHHGDSFDGMSDIADSVADDSTAFSGISSLRSQSYYRKTRQRTSSSSLLSQDLRRLDAIEEEQEDAKQYEAYLRAKMFALWNRIQHDFSERDELDLSESPSTEEDIEMLKAFERTTETLQLLRGGE